MVLTRMADADGPWPSARRLSGQIQVAARVDRVVLVRAQFPRRHVDGQPLCHRAEIQDEWTQQRDRFLIDVHPDIAIADRSAAIVVGARQTNNDMRTLGLIGALYAIYRIAKSNYPKDKVWATFAPYAVLIVVLTAINVGLFSLPMAMRM